MADLMLILLASWVYALVDGKEHNIQLRTGRLTRTWLIENYARVVKENGCWAVNTNNTLENTLKMPYRLNVSRIFY